jgi:tetratricopeptide (TPR) repeat protein
VVISRLRPRDRSPLRRPYPVGWVSCLLAATVATPARAETEGGPLAVGLQDVLELLRRVAGGLDWPWWIGGLALGAACLFGVSRLARLLGGLQGPVGKLTPPQARREAKRAARRGEFLQAGRLFEAAGDWGAAAEAYERAQAYADAAVACERQGQAAKAARLLETAGQFGRAAELLLRGGQPARAAALYLKGGEDVKAAEAYEKAGEAERAATLFAKQEAYDRAAGLRERLGQALPAAELLERHLDRLRLRTTEETPEGLRFRQETARRAAALFTRAGEHARAARLLLAQELESEAAEACCLAGEWERGLEILLRRGQFDRAAALCRAHGRSAELPLILGEQHAAAGRDGEAAQAFETAGLWWRAGELYERAGQHARAAEMYAQHGDEERAAEMFVAAREPARAAAALERMGRFAAAARQYQEAGALREAAQALQRAGDLYGAAQMLLQIQAADDAVRLLQQIPAETPEYRQAAGQLGDLFLQRGLLGPAREKFEQAAALATASRDQVHSHYQLGVISELQGQPTEALRFFEKVMAERLDYRDVQARVSAIRRQFSATAAMGSIEGATQAIGATTAGPTRTMGTSRYRILRELGRGGMGIVYQAEDTVLRRPVAYKVLPDAIRDDPKALEYFLREARIAASLQHPNIVTIYDAGQAGQQVYIAMEFVEGRSLESLLDEKGCLPLPQTLEIFRQACRSLAHAHARQIVHRDVKPGNMMLAAGGVVKLMDFGLAAVVTEVTAKVTSIRGTPFYMAPEQILGQMLSPHTDQYALGCTLYHMATGHPPFVEGDVLYHHIHTAPASPRTGNPAIPVWLDAIILRSMAKEPATRFPSVAALWQEVESCLNSVRSRPIVNGA